MTILENIIGKQSLSAELSTVQRCAKKSFALSSSLFLEGKKISCRSCAPSIFANLSLQAVELLVPVVFHFPVMLLINGAAGLKNSISPMGLDREVDSKIDLCEKTMIFSVCLSFYQGVRFLHFCLNV